jgi:hypothetical protein
MLLQRFIPLHDLDSIDKSLDFQEIKNLHISTFPTTPLKMDSLPTTESKSIRLQSPEIQVRLHNACFDFM